MNDKYYWKLLQMFISYYADLAQLVEHFVYTEGVRSSNLLICMPWRRNTR